MRALPLTVSSAPGRGRIFLRVLEPERAEALFQPWIQALLPATIEQLGEDRVHERLEMVRVANSRAAERVPDVGKFAVFDAVETNIGHPARVLRRARSASPRPAAMLDNIDQKL